MASKTTRERARKDQRGGKRPMAAADAGVRGEMEHVRRGKPAARSPKPAMAIAPEKTRRSATAVAPAHQAMASERPRRTTRRPVSPSRATTRPRRKVR